MKLIGKTWILEDVTSDPGAKATWGHYNKGMLFQEKEMTKTDRFCTIAAVDGIEFRVLEGNMQDNAKRDMQMVLMRLDELRYSTIGDIFGVTDARVRQVIAKHNRIAQRAKFGHNDQYKEYAKKWELHCKMQPPGVVPVLQ